MIKQTLMFKNPADLSLRQNQLVIRQKDIDREVTRPIEDIGVIVIESQMVKMTVPLLNELANQNVAVIFCDERTMPKSMLMTLEGNATLQESYRAQAEATLPMKKKIWKQIVETKIKNQSKLLHKIGKDGDVLKSYYMNVKSGDSDNREGTAAKIYWNMLLGQQFKRARDGTPPNNLLNYGYAILRAAVARALLGSGLYPAFGIFHRNRYNAFPLADDMMEPYRPFVDETAYHLYYDGNHSELDQDAKFELQRILFCDVKMGQVTRPLEIALSSTTASLLKAFRNETDKLSLPLLE
ncbi:MAG: type II CRISPR-associated endonuclease Cas1 [Paraprevotella sp.]|nr:type II CRISPR-associated endonuclease Cas1 [Paraprevotella sp.]